MSKRPFCVEVVNSTSSPGQLSIRVRDSDGRLSVGELMRVLTAYGYQAGDVLQVSFAWTNGKLASTKDFSDDDQ